MDSSNPIWIRQILYGFVKSYMDSSNPIWIHQILYGFVKNILSWTISTWKLTSMKFSLEPTDSPKIVIEKSQRSEFPTHTRFVCVGKF